jgi:hypothetical protein
MRRLQREQHESEDTGAVLFREEAEAVPAESEEFCRSDNMRSAMIRYVFANYKRSY